MKLIKSFNPMTRLINWMIKPLLPIRLFADDESDYGEYIGTDEDGQSYFVDDDGTITMTDSDGNVLASETKDEYFDPTDDSWDDYAEVTYDTDTEHTFTWDDNGNLVYADGDNAGEAVDTSSWGNVIGVGNQDGVLSGYQYNEKTGKYEGSNGRSYSLPQLDHVLDAGAIYGMSGDSTTKMASNIASVLGNNLNSTNVNTLSQLIESGQGETIRQAFADAEAAKAAGQTDTGLNVMVGVLSGTIPPDASMREAKAISEIVERMEKGEELKDAFYSVCDQYGYTQNEKMNATLKDSAINVALMAAGPILNGLLAAKGFSAASALAHANKMGKVKNFISSPFGQAFVTSVNTVFNAGLKNSRTVQNVASFMDFIGNMGKSFVTAGEVATGLGIGFDEAQKLADAWNENYSKYEGSQNYYDTLGQSAIRNTTTEKVPETTTATAKPEPTPEPAKTTEKTPEDTSKAASITFNPTYTGGVSFPTNVGVDWLEVERGREKEPEKAEPEVEGFDSESGDDTLETTTQDAPTGGVGTDTFTNTNTDQGKKGWGLGEEDPNRANYDVDKWNRGMERVSTDVVSDAKCKDFITKTFKDDPVLIKTVKIMKSKS